VRRWTRTASDSSRESVEDALRKLDETRFIVVDWDTVEILIRTYIRNDGLYKQPKVMVSALRSALLVESPRLRSALAEELYLLPGFSEKEDWQKVANALADTLSEGYAEGYREGYPEGYRRGVGVGVGEGVGGINSLLREEDKPKTAVGRTEKPNIVYVNGDTVAVSVEAREVVHAVLSGAVLKANKKGLYGNAQKLLDAGATPEQVHATLVEWSRRTDVYPGHLPHIFTELSKRAAGGSSSASAQRAAAPSSKLRDYANLTQELRAAEQNQRKGIQ
jgi:hypothetical protein